MDEATLVRDVTAILEAHPAVRKVSLVGSRARGDATRFSDWDIKVETDDFPSLASDLPSITERLRPLVAQWDRLSDGQCYMLILDGPQKVDLLFDEPHVHEPPHVVSAKTMCSIDEHFWDWTLWLTSKVAAGKDDLVRAELAKMTDHLLGPLGVATPPETLSEAVDVYVSARDEHEQRFEVRSPRELGTQVVRRIRDQVSPG